MAVVDDKSKGSKESDDSKDGKDTKTPPEGDKKEAKNDKEDDDEEPEDDSKTYTAEAYKKVQGEAKERRLALKERDKKIKELEEKQSRQDRALEILTGKKKEGDIDPLEVAKKAADQRLKNALMKAALASVARDAHDSALLFRAYGDHFKDVTVDVDAEFVDEEELTAAVDKLRKSKAFLFAVADDPKQKNSRLPLDKGSPKSGANHRAIWNQLNDAGRAAEAGAYYKEHASDIRAQMKND